MSSTTGVSNVPWTYNSCASYVINIKDKIIHGYVFTEPTTVSKEKPVNVQSNNQLLEDSLERLRSTVFDDLPTRCETLKGTITGLSALLNPSEIKDANYLSSLQACSGSIEQLKTWIIEVSLIRPDLYGASVTQQSMAATKEKNLNALQKYLEDQKLLDKNLSQKCKDQVLKIFIQHFAGLKINKAEIIVANLARHFNIDLKTSFVNRCWSALKSLGKALLCLIVGVTAFVLFLRMGKVEKIFGFFVQGILSFSTALCAFGITSTVNSCRERNDLEKEFFNNLKQILVTNDEAIKDVRKIFQNSTVVWTLSQDNSPKIIDAPLKDLITELKKGALLAEYTDKNFHELRQIISDGIKKINGLRKIFQTDMGIAALSRDPSVNKIDNAMQEVVEKLTNDKSLQKTSGNFNKLKDTLITSQKAIQNLQRFYQDEKVKKALSPENFLKKLETALDLERMPKHVGYKSTPNLLQSNSDGSLTVIDNQANSQHLNKISKILTDGMGTYIKETPKGTRDYI